MDRVESDDGPSLVAGRVATAPRRPAVVEWMLWLAVTGLVLVIVQRAWVGDDAFISLRTIDNFLHGDGLRFNVKERVQAYTHPLWLVPLTVAYAITHEPVVTTIFVSLSFTGAALWVLLTRVLDTPLERVVAVLLLSLSHGFIDYSTSGLENPLTHLLVLIALWRSEAETRPLPLVFTLALCSSLLALSRPDALLLTLPLWGWSVHRAKQPGKAAIASLGGGVPLFGWTFFSIVYYGSPVPNTAISKLAHGLPRTEVVAQGLVYFVQMSWFDPAVLVLLALAIGLSARRLLTRFWMAGALLYVVYAVSVGGGHMLGRFTTAPYLVAVVVVARAISPRSVRDVGWFAVGAHALLAFAGRSPLAAGNEFRTPGGLRDEREAYANVSLRAHPLRNFGDFPAQQFADAGRTLHDVIADDYEPEDALEAERVVAAGAAGMRAYYAGRELHFVDVLALTDPLLARLPAIHARDWRVDHFKRRVPTGYLASVEANENRVVDRAVRALYDDVRRVTRGKFWTVGRWQAIWRLNTGAHAAVSRLDYLRRPGTARAKILRPLEKPKPWSVPLRDGEMAEFELDEPALVSRLRFVAESSASFDVFLMNDEGQIARVHVDGESGKKPGTTTVHSLALPSSARRRPLVSGYAVAIGSPDLRYRTYEFGRVSFARPPSSAP